MDLRRTLVLANEALTGIGISHALIGGFALAVHHVQRATQDIDFLADGARADEIINVLTSVGFVLDHATPEVLHFSGIGLLDVLLAHRPMSLKMLKDAKEEERLHVRVLKVEDLIGLKIQAYKNDSAREFQDKADIQNLLRKNPAIDFAKIKVYADLFGEWPFIESLSGRP